MPNNFFDKYPSVTYYGDVSLRNIILKSRIIREVFNHYDSFYPYVLEEWERPDTVAADYYGDSKYYWVVLMSNDIIDPYYNWPLGYHDFLKYLENKYKMTIDETKSHILHYEYRGIEGNEFTDLEWRKDWILPIETFEYIDRVIGYVNVIAGNNTVTAINANTTYFTVDLSVGDTVYFPNINETHTVSSIANSTIFNTTSSFVNTKTNIPTKLYYEPLGLIDRYSPEGWQPVYAYDYEVEQNDKKRSIRLLDRKYLAQVEQEVGIVLNRKL